MGVSDLGTVTFQGVAALGILSGVAVSFSTLTRSERIRRRLKTNTEILASLAERSREACLIQELVTQDTDLLYALTFPTPRSELQRWSRYERLGGLVTILLSAGFSIFGASTNLQVSGILTGLLSVAGAFLAFSVSRQMAATRAIKDSQG